MSIDNKKTLSLQDKIEQWVLPIGEKIGNNKYLATIRKAMSTIIPVTIIGGIALMLAFPPIPSDTSSVPGFLMAFLNAWQNWSNIAYKPLMSIYNVTLNSISLYVVTAVAYFHAEQYKMDRINNMFAALFVFLISSSAFNIDAGSMNMSALGAQNMFGALILGIVTVEINKIFIDKNIAIKMPDSVPPNVAAPFNLLIPVGFNVIVFALLNHIIYNLTGQPMTDLIYLVLTPLVRAGGSTPFVLLAVFLTMVFCFFGIHGGLIVGSIFTPIYTVNFQENLAAWTAGDRILPHIWASSASSIFGNDAAMVAAVIVAAFFCRSTQVKSVGRAAIIPQLFCISEPIWFGSIVMNPFLVIPYIFVPIINLIIYAVLANLNLVGRVVMDLPFTTPEVIRAGLATMDFRAVIVVIVLIVLDVFLYLPFYKAYDAACLKQESESVEK